MSGHLRNSMKRRTALEILGFSAGAFAFIPRHFPSGEPGDWHQDRGGELESAFSHLRGDSGRPAFVRKTEKGWTSVRCDCLLHQKRDLH